MPIMLQTTLLRGALLREALLQVLQRCTKQKAKDYDEGTFTSMIIKNDTSRLVGGMYAFHSKLYELAVSQILRITLIA